MIHVVWAEVIHMKVLITFTKDPITINFVGGPAMIYGYVNAYLFDRNLPDGAADNSKPHHLRKVRTDHNDNFAPGSGCVRIVPGMHAIVKNCYLRATFVSIYRSSATRGHP
jgi:hypothetical protein